MWGVLGCVEGVAANEELFDILCCKLCKSLQLLDVKSKGASGAFDGIEKGCWYEDLVTATTKKGIIPHSKEEGNCIIM